MRTEVTHSVKNAHKNFLCPVDTVLQLEKVTEGGLEVIFSGQLSSGPSLPVIRPFPTKFGGLRVQVLGSSWPSARLVRFASLF